MAGRQLRCPQLHDRKRHLAAICVIGADGAVLGVDPMLLYSMCRKSPPRLHAIPFLAFAALAVVAGVLAPAPRAAAVAQRNPEDLLVVDCLLPGQVRKLGSNSVFMSARRPVRTIQSECEIRGGEYVSYDRANYQTALKVWQGQAEGGDAEAQNYVGEIYLKGLGTEPDYAKAAQWFEKAAAQGSRRARINLGYMYEQGLGVSQDTAKALNLYRDASGLSGDKLVFASSVTAEVQQAHAETQAVREQLSSEQRKSEQLRAQVEKLQGDLRQRQQKYDKSQRELNDARGKLDVEQKKLGVEKDPGYGKLKADLDARERSLADQQRELQKARQASARQQADAEAEATRLYSREKQLTGAQSAANARELSALRDSAAKNESALTQARARSNELQQQLDRNEQQREEAQAQFDGARMQLAQQRTQNEDSTRLLKLMEVELREKRQELSSERSQLTALRAQLDATPGRDASTTFSTASVGGGLRVEILQPTLTVTRGSSKPAASLPPAQNSMDIVGRVVAPAGLTTLSVNDQPVTADASGSFTTQVAASGDSTAVHVAALDKRGEKAVLDFVLLPAPSGSATSSQPRGQVVNTLPRGVQLGRYYALVVGNDVYTGYPALKGAVADATTVAGLLKSRYGYETHLLTNANRFEILSALNDMREQLKEEDNLLIYYAGHGEVDPAKQGYWLPVDAQAEQPSSWISNRAVSDILTTMNAKHVLVIADSCYSGTMTRTSLATFGGGMATDSWGDWVKTMVAGRSRTALTSGGVQPVADATRGEHSMFAGALIGALSDNNQLLTGQRLYREIAASMALKGANAGLQQVPEYSPIQFAGHEAGEFFFMPRS
jgi:predicted  nucleic acid-binding Zn-ribbon protein